MDTQLRRLERILSSGDESVAEQYHRILIRRHANAAHFDITADEFRRKAARNVWVKRVRERDCTCQRLWGDYWGRGPYSGGATCSYREGHVRFRWDVTARVKAIQSLRRN